MRFLSANYHYTINSTHFISELLIFVMSLLGQERMHLLEMRTDMKETIRPDMTLALCRIFKIYNQWAEKRRCWKLHCMLR